LRSKTQKILLLFLLHQSGSYQGVRVQEFGEAGERKIKNFELA
jgi:hypothetical protein